MTLLPLLLAQAARPGIVLPRKPVPADAAEIRRVRAFLDVVLTTLDPNEHVPNYDADLEPQIDRPSLANPGGRTYQFKISWVNVDPQGRIVTFSGGSGDHVPYRADGSLVPRKVSDREAAAIAQRAYAAAGWPERIRVEEVTDLRDTNESCVEVRYVPTVGGIPYERHAYEETMDLDRLDGSLATFAHLGDVPTAPASLVPAGSPADARLAALRYGAANGQTGRADPGPKGFELRLWLPPISRYSTPASVAREIKDPRVRANAVARRAMLVYVGRVHLGPGRDVDMILDAQTGETLGFDVMDLREIGPRMGGALPAVKARPVAPPTGLRPWRVARGAGWKAWSRPARAALAPAPASPIVGSPVALSDGTLALSGTYDPKANLFVVAGKPSQAYRPGPALTALLKARAKG